MSSKFQQGVCVWREGWVSPLSHEIFLVLSYSLLLWNQISEKFLKTSDFRNALRQLITPKLFSRASTAANCTSLSHFVPQIRRSIYILVYKKINFLIASTTKLRLKENMKNYTQCIILHMKISVTAVSA